MDEAKRNPSPGVEGGPSSDSTAAAAAAAAAADRIVPVQSVGLLGLGEAAADLASGRPSTGNSTGSTTTTSNGDKAPSETKQQDHQQQQEQQEEEEQTSCTATTVAPSSSSLLQSVETTFQTSAADVLSSARGHHPHHRAAEEISWLAPDDTSREHPMERQREFAERRRSQETTSIYTVGAQILRDLLQEEVDEGLNPQDSGECDLAVLQDQPARDGENGRRRRRQQILDDNGHR